MQSTFGEPQVKAKVKMGVDWPSFLFVLLVVVMTFKARSLWVSLACSEAHHIGNLEFTAICLSQPPEYWD